MIVIKNKLVIYICIVFVCFPNLLKAVSLTSHVSVEIIKPVTIKVEDIDYGEFPVGKTMYTIVHSKKKFFIKLKNLKDDSPVTLVINEPGIYLVNKRTKDKLLCTLNIHSSKATFQTTGDVVTEGLISLLGNPNESGEYKGTFRIDINYD